jgi:hypothetical protein
MTLETLSMISLIIKISKSGQYLLKFSKQNELHRFLHTGRRFSRQGIKYINN